MFGYYQCYISIELTFLKELMLIKQVNQNNANFFAINIFQKKDLTFNQMTAIDAMIY